MVWAGECTDLIADVAPAGDLVTRIAAEAEQVLGNVARRAGSDSTSVRQSARRKPIPYERDKRKLDALRLRVCRAAARARALPTRPIEPEAEGESP